ncbi:leucine zipper putative tumor suppressor 1 [Ambystoma mexicanum]|uniref:leucine zipper putative tumor suppressor 1 n=1 Tax=Ambystoma mexicanum TaxID=8296 RepID=UPI0037E8E38C
MGSVSSLISSHNFNSRNCRGSQYKLRKSSHLKKLNRYSDGLLRFGFSQESSHGKTSSKIGKSEDFFYIKVSQKSSSPQRAEYASLSGTERELGSQSAINNEYANPSKVKQFSNHLELGSEKNVLRPTGFNPALRRNSATILLSTSENGSQVLHQVHYSQKLKDGDSRPSGYSGGLSDSGRNSMSSLPTHSTTSSYQLDPLLTPIGYINRFGGSAHNITQSTVIQDSNMISLKAMSLSDGGNSNKIINVPPKASQVPEKICLRSPISTDESSIQELEQRLKEKDGELQDLQCSFEEKEVATCHVYEEKQRRSKEDLDGIKHKSSTKLRQASIKAQRANQLMHLQVFQLQQDKRQLREDMENLLKERDLLQTKLRSYEKEKTNFVPALEETQWEVCQKSGEISLLKQQLKESQSDLSLKTSETLSLKAQLKDARGKIEAHEQKAREMEDALRTKAVELEVCENELQRKKNEAELLREKVGRLEEELMELRAEVGRPTREWAHDERAGPAAEERLRSLQKEVEELKNDLEEERQNNEQMTNVFQHERQIWKEEKEKVIRYQKQLQQNYLHMYKRNQALERSVQQLTGGESEEGGSQDILDFDLHGMDVPFEDIIATEI